MAGKRHHAREGAQGVGFVRSWPLPLDRVSSSLSGYAWCQGFSGAVGDFNRWHGRWQAVCVMDGLARRRAVRLHRFSLLVDDVGDCSFYVLRLP